MRQIDRPDPEARILIRGTAGGIGLSTSRPSPPSDIDLTSNTRTLSRPSPSPSLAQQQTHHKSSRNVRAIATTGGPSNASSIFARSDDSSWVCPRCTCVNPWPLNLDTSSRDQQIGVEEAHFCSACGERSPRNLREQAMQKVFDRINTVCTSLGEPFVDDNFPPARTSLLLLASHANEWRAGGGVRVEDNQPSRLCQFVVANLITWRRPRELDPTRQWTIFKELRDPGTLPKAPLVIVGF